MVDAGIRFYEKLHTLTSQTMEADPLVYGGEMGRDGLFIPARLKTVYVTPNGGISYGTGVPEWVGYEISKRESGLPSSRELPDDIDIIYLDEKGQAIKDRVPPSRGDEIEGFSSRESDTTGDSASEQVPLDDDFDNSFPDDLPPFDTELPQFEKPNFPPSVADLEKQLAPERIESELGEGLSPERFRKGQQLIDWYGTEEGLRRLGESDPEAARRFEQERRGGASRDAPRGHTRRDDQPPDGSP